MKMSMAKSRQLFSPKRSVIDVKRALNRPLRAKHASSMTSEKTMPKIKSAYLRNVLVSRLSKIELFLKMSGDFSAYNVSVYVVFLSCISLFN